MRGRPDGDLPSELRSLLLTVLRTISVQRGEVAGQVCVLLSPLSEVQQRLLDLWDLPPHLYEDVILHFPKPPRSAANHKL